MGTTTSKNIVLRDGTIVGSASDDGQALAKAIARMHSIFRDCDCEFAVLSDAANVYGRTSDQYKTAARSLDACQRRRTTQFHIIEACCGPAQGGYADCVREKGAGREHECLSVLHAYLDCADKALKDKEPR